MATKYSNNLEVRLNQPLDTKYVCENLSDLTDYLYVGLITFCKADKTSYCLKEFKDGSPVWEPLNSGYKKGIMLGTEDPSKGSYIDINHLVLGSEFYISSQTDFEGLGQYSAEISLRLGTALSVGDDGKLGVDITNITSEFPSAISIGTNIGSVYELGTLIISTGLNLGRSSSNTYDVSLKIGDGLKFDSDGTLCLSTDSGSSDSSGGIGISTDASGTPLMVSTLILGSAEAFYVNGSSGRLSLVLSTALQIYDQKLDLSTEVKEQLESGGGGSSSGTSIVAGTGLDLDGSRLNVQTEKWSLSTGLNMKPQNDNVVLELSLGRGLTNSSVFEVNIGSGLHFDSGNAIEVDIDNLPFQEKLEDGINIKTINGNSILGEGNLSIQFELGSSDFINGGVINITKTGDIETIYNSMSIGAVALCIIGDSNGSYPSSETRVNVNSEYTVSSNYFFSEDVKGANVGDMLMVTKQSYLLINRCALKIIPLYDSKTATEEYTATDGIMTVWDKTRVNKIDGIEWTANDTRAWLNGVVNTDLRKTKYGYDTPLEDCIKTGVLAYTNATINDITANWTIFVDCTTDTDGGGYYHLIQTAVCRDEGEYLGRMWKRLGYYTSNTAPEFLEWKEITNAGLEARIAALEAQISSMTTETEV